MNKTDALINAGAASNSDIERAPRAMYTHAFRQNAVQLVLRDGKGVAQAARELDVNVKTYANWLKLARAGTLGAVDAHRVQPVTDLQSELARVKRALAQVTEERDILKKATAYFAAQSR
ncbi:transposase [Ottowia sp.]|uniref:transposase n=1 Tax=Ottowia sp. TaxID=1898956 RepID=UPI003A865D2D